MSSLTANTRPVPRLVIAAPQGRSGKTTVTLGLCAALSARGMQVQPFKKGPDYIDPSWLTEAARRPCRNLDPFFLASPDHIRRAFMRGCREADMAVVEGNHGLYDSLDEEGQTSTAAVARALRSPVLLVVNTERMSRSVAALVHGYQTFEPDTWLAGVILNNVSRSRHEQKLRQAIEKHCRIPVVGAVPRSARLTIPDRHLGLVPRGEDDMLLPALQACRDAVEQYVDLDAVVALARSAPPLPDVSRSGCCPLTGQANAVRIGVLRDRAFSFYYPENLEALVEAGASLVFIDALHTAGLPPVEALYIGGGFPEMFMDELAANRDLRQDIRQAAEHGLPIYAECGGLMYLSRRIYWRGRAAEMVGVLPCAVEVTDRPQGHGYVIAESTGDNPFFPAGSLIRGHEFHHSRVVNCYADLPPAYRLQRGTGLGKGVDGLVYRNVVAAYTHLHAASAPGWAEGMVRMARLFKQEVMYNALV